MSDCARCGASLPDKPAGHPGRPRKWCSDNCRKRAWENENDRAPCADCGELMGTRSRNRSERCRTCHDRREAAARRARLEDVAEMYRSGMPCREMAEQMGWSRTSDVGVLVNAARKAGLLTEYRYDDQRRRNAAEARWAA